MRRITLDANVIAAGFISRTSASARLLNAWRTGKFQLILSEHLLREVARTFTDRYFAERLDHEEAVEFVALLRSDGVVSELTMPVQGVATHPEDDLVLSTALSGEATILCTRDKQLLKLGRYQTVTILSPGELLALLESEGQS